MLAAKSHTGAGVFADVAYVVRGMTEGGVAPSRGCVVGQELRVPYQAAYTFFWRKPLAKHETLP